MGAREMRQYSAQRHRKQTGLVMALGEAGRVIGGGIPPDLLPFYRSGSSGGPQIQRGHGSK